MDTEADLKAGRVTVLVQPRSRSTAVIGRHGDAIKIHVTPPPVDGAANEAVIRLIARRTGRRRSDVRVLAGHASKRKIIEVDGMSASEVKFRLTITSAKIRL